MRHCRFNGAYSRDSLPRIKDGAYDINIDDKKSKEAHWVSLFIDKNCDSICKYFKDKYDKMISLDFRLKKIDKTINYLLEEIKYNSLKSEKRKIKNILGI